MLAVESSRCSRRDVDKLPHARERRIPSRQTGDSRRPESQGLDIMMMLSRFVSWGRSDLEQVGKRKIAQTLHPLSQSFCWSSRVRPVGDGETIQRHRRLLRLSSLAVCRGSSRSIRRWRVSGSSATMERETRCKGGACKTSKGEQVSPGAVCRAGLFRE